jgi:CPA2 family monovalent cation:H+ antiporter-2
MLLLLGWAILPPWPVLVALAVLLAGVTALQWRRFERVYAAAQESLRQTLTLPPDAPEEPARPLPALLRGAVLESVELPPDAAGAGKLIRELQLRSRSGASAVGIERGEASVVNPGPDEELRAGDRILLIGHPPQIAAARRLLVGACNS